MKGMRLLAFVVLSVLAIAALSAGGEAPPPVPIPIHPDPAALTTLQRQALTGGQPASARLAQPDVYAAVAPLVEPDGNVAGLVQTELPATDIAHSLDQLRRTLLLLAVSMGWEHLPSHPDPVERLRGVQLVSSPSRARSAP